MSASSSSGTEASLLGRLGAMALLQGDHAAALRALEEAARASHRDAGVWSNLGEARRRTGDSTGAREAFRAALEIDPDRASAIYGLGRLAFDGGDFEEAARRFGIAARRKPRNVTFVSAEADASRAQGRYRRAVRCYRRALELEADHLGSVRNLGRLLLRTGRFEEAEPLLRRAVELAPGDGRDRLELGRALVYLERLDEAMGCFADAAERMGDDDELHTAIAQVWREVEDLAQAEHWFLRALEVAPGNLQARCGLAAIHRQASLHDHAVRQLEELAAEHPESAVVAQELGQAHWDAGDADRSVRAFRRAMELRPRNAALRARVGHVLASAGAVEEALEQFREALVQNPRCIPALHGLALAQRDELSDDHLEQMIALVAEEALGDGARASLHNGLAHAFDARSRYELAAEHAGMANALQWAHRERRGWSYDVETFERSIDDTIELCSASFLRGRHGWGLDDPTPVFVVGMPRSGTTLTEQILAAHPRVLGIGERDLAGRSVNLLETLVPSASRIGALRDASPAVVSKIAQEYLAGLGQIRAREEAPEAVRIVDKLPDNYLLLGWLVTMFRRVRIFYCRRDPRDIAVSCWLTQFAKIRWACHFEHLAHRIRQHRRLMGHWRRTLPVEILEVDYESTVADPEGTARRLVEFLGLEWDPACLRYAENDRLVRTASVTQVRQPIYRRSVERWRRYEEPLADLFQRIPARPGGAASP